MFSGTYPAVASLSPLLWCCCYFLTSRSDGCRADFEAPCTLGWVWDGKKEENIPFVLTGDMTS